MDSVIAFSAPDPEVPTVPANRPLGAVRFDLRLRKHHYQGEAWGVVKDPVALKYVRVPWQDIELGRYFDGVRSARRVAQAWLREMPELRLVGDEAAWVEKALRLHADLARLGLVQVGAKGALALERARRESIRRNRPLKWLTGWLMIRWSLWDPDRLLGFLAPRLGWVLGGTAQGLALGLVLLAAALLAARWDEIRFDMGWFLSIPNLVGLYVAFFTMKMLHELGHALACKHYGGEVHEMGVMCFALQPFFYVNVSDAWLLPEKGRRIVVAAAGMWVELVVSAVLLFLWTGLAPGYWRDLALATVAMAGLTTVLTNANPLMKFDGYYILSDWLEIPNLRDKAMRMIGRQFRKLLYGPEVADALDPALGASRRGGVLLLYSVLSFGYVGLLVWHVLGMLDHLLDAVGLRFLAHGLVLLWIAGFIVIPIALFFHRTQQAMTDLPPAARRRPLRIGLAALLLVALFASLPWPRVVTRSCVLEPAHPELLRLPSAGFVREIYVREGDRVAPGQLIARLENETLAAERDAAAEQVARADAERQRALSEGRSQDYLAAARTLDGYRARLAELDRQLAGLRVLASSAGRVVTRDVHRQTGLRFEAGDTLATIVPEELNTFLVPLDEREARWVRAGQPVALKVRAFPDRTFRGAITRDPIRAEPDDLPASIAARRGGDVEMAESPEGVQRLLRPQFFAQLRIEGESLPLRSGMTGRVRIRCGPSRVWKLVGQRLIDFVNLDYQL